MIDIEPYKRFMGITDFPIFEVEYFEHDLSRKYVSFAQAEYSFHSGIQTLRLPSNINIGYGK